jgi:hypothetical protein
MVDASEETKQDKDNFIQWCEASKQIQGRFLDSHAFVWEQIFAFQEKQSISGQMLEIGALHGRSAAYMALQSSTPEELLVADINISDALVANVQSVRSNPTPKENFIEVDSYYFPRELLAKYARSMRFIHIDGEHSSEAIYNDLNVAKTLLNRRGIITLDDFLNERFVHLLEPVFTWLREHAYEFRLIACGDSKGYIATQQCADAYIKFIGPRIAAGRSDPKVTFTVFNTYTFNGDVLGLRRQSSPTRSGESLSARPPEERRLKHKPVKATK